MSTRPRSNASAIALCALFCALFGSSSAFADDPLDAFRERFKAGLEHYKAGEYGDAIRTWEPIYRDLGASRGYRMAFDLGRAYEGNRDLSHAADNYLAFIDQVNVRRESGDAIAPLVAAEETQAIARLRELDRTQGKIVVDRGARAVDVKIDDRDPRLAGFVAYVVPGAHVVTLDPGTPQASSRRIDVQAGGVFELAPSSFTPIVGGLTPSPAPLAPDIAFPIRRPGPPSRFETEHPFSPWILAVSGGAALASIIIPAAAYVSATSFQSSNHLSASASDPRNQATQDGYDRRVGTFYGTLAIPIVLGVVTGGLATWYFAGATTKETPMVSASASPYGGSLELRARF
ncbi:MAG: hypothetical protein ABI551_12260 [Polyangiaceae bacterium]